MRSSNVRISLTHENVPIDFRAESVVPGPKYSAPGARCVVLGATTPPTSMHWGFWYVAPEPRASNEVREQVSAPTTSHVKISTLASYSNAVLRTLCDTQRKILRRDRRLRTQVTCGRSISPHQQLHEPRKAPESSSILRGQLILGLKFILVLVYLSDQIIQRPAVSPHNAVELDAFTKILD